MKKKMVIVVALVLVLLLGAVGAGFYVIWNKLSNLTPPAQASAGAEVAAEEESGPPPVGPILDLNTFIVNLADEDVQRFLKTSISLEMDAPEGLEEATTRLPQIKDYVVTLLPSKKSADILSTEGKQVLRTQLIDGMNRFLTKGKVNTLYFTDFVIQ